MAEELWGSLFGTEEPTAVSGTAVSEPTREQPGEGVESLIEKYSSQYGLNPNFAKAVLYQESGFDPNAQNSSSGAAGLGQFMQSTWDAVAEQMGEESGDRFDIDTSARRAVFHLADLQKKLGGEEQAAAAYKAGEGAVAAAGGVPQREERGGYDPHVNETTADYVNKVLTHKQIFEGGGAVTPRKTTAGRGDDMWDQLFAGGAEQAVATPTQAPQPPEKKPLTDVAAAPTIEPDKPPLAGFKRVETVPREEKKPSFREARAELHKTIMDRGKVLAEAQKRAKRGDMELPDWADPKKMSDDNRIALDYYKGMKETERGTAFASGVVGAVIPFGSKLKSGVQKQAEEEEPFAAGAGKVAGTIFATLAVGSALNNVSKLQKINQVARTVQNPALRRIAIAAGNMIPRVVAGNIVSGTQQLELLTEGEQTFGDALQRMGELSGAHAVSVLPEVFLPRNFIQPFAQALTGAAYNFLYDKSIGRKYKEEDLLLGIPKNYWVEAAVDAGFGFFDMDGEKWVQLPKKGMNVEIRPKEGSLADKLMKEMAPPHKEIPVVEPTKVETRAPKTAEELGIEKPLADVPEVKFPTAEPEVVARVQAEQAPKGTALPPEVEVKAEIEKITKPKPAPSPEKVKAAKISGEIEDIQGKVDLKKEQPARSFEKSVSEVVRLENKPQDIARDVESKEADRQGAEFTNKLERLYTREKEAAFPIQKAQRVFERESGKKLLPKESLVNKIDAVRGAGGIAEQFRKDNLDPIFKDLRVNPRTGKGRTGVQRGKAARDLEEYLIAKRQKWLYENKAGYGDEGYSKDKANDIVAKVENATGAEAEQVRDSAKKIWGYTVKLKDVKRQYGIIDETFNEALKEPYYVPFYRDIEAQKVASPIGGERFTTTSRGIKRIKGSKRGIGIRNVYQNLIEQTNETMVNAMRNDVFRGLISMSEKSPKLSEIITKLPPRFRKAGRIEHRTEIDKVLSPKLDKMISTLKAEKDIKIRTGKKLGAYDPENSRVTLMFGASESSKSHELGHHIDEKVMPMRSLVNKHKEEFQAVADMRYQGEEVSQKFINYTRQSDEKAAEFVAMYVTDRTALARVAPNALAEFEAKISKHPVLKGLVDMVPTRVAGIEKITEDNFVTDNSIPRDADVISGFVEGKLVHYRVPAELATAVKNLNPQQIPTLLRIIAAPTSILRRSAVGLNIDFFVPNALRDQINTTFHSKSIPGWDFLLGAKHTIAQDEVYKQYMRMGGAMDAPESGVRQLKTSAAELVHGSKHGKFLDPDYWKEHGKLRTAANLSGYILSSPFRGISALAEVSEMSTRLGVFGRHMKSGDDVKEAVHTARQASLDFQRFGSGGVLGGRIPNSVIPFVNAALEGVDRMGRSLYTNPKRFAMAAFTYGVAPTIGLLAWNQQNKNYRNVSDREKANNYIIMKSEDSKDYWKIPKSHAIKLVVNPLQLAYERAANTSEGKWTDVASAAFATVSPIDNVGTIVPTALKLLVEPIANYDFYWGKTIEPETIQRIGKPGLRYKRGTSETLKTIGEALNVSPIMMQHEINTLFSGLGRHSLLGLDWALGVTGVQKPPTITEDRIPILRRFQGKTEVWKSEVAKHVREIDSSIRRIERLSENSLIKYNGYSPKEARKALRETKAYQTKLEKKQRELIKANNALDLLQSRIRKEYNK